MLFIWPGKADAFQITYEIEELSKKKIEITKALLRLNLNFVH